MAYNPIYTNASPINEAFPDPIYERKVANDEITFRKYNPNEYTQPLHFPNYLTCYTPNHPIPPVPPTQSYNYYPRSNLQYSTSIWR